MPIKTASWNCSLGLLRKVDLVKIMLTENKLDLLFLQETEIKQNTPIQALQITGYNLELSPTYGQQNSRTCCYVKTSLKYERLSEIENSKVELIAIKTLKQKICGYYRPFLMPNHENERDYITDTLEILEKLPSINVTLLGDFNIDFSKISNQNYKNKKLYDELESLFIEKTLVQIIDTNTWRRKFGDELKESILDHIYVNNLSAVESSFNDQQIVGDHNLVGLILKVETENYPTNYPSTVLDWTNYSKDALIQKLSNYNFNELENLEVESHISELNQILGTIVDELIPTIKLKRREVPGFISINYVKQNRQRKNYYKKFKKTRDPKFLEKSRNLEKTVRKDIEKLKRDKIRSKIKPGDSKSLWEAVNISMNKINGSLPDTVTWRNKEAVSDQEKAELFCEFFNDKTTNIIRNNPHNKNVYNGRKLVNNNAVQNFTLNEILKVLKSIPIKNCSGIDRIPMRIFNDGKEILAPTLFSLMTKIWQTETIPEIWKTTKTQPLHKTGNKMQAENYRPISNLCSLSKIFEKLIQLKLNYVAEINNIDLTNSRQHGFKTKHSTVTAMLEIQNKLAKALDKNEFAALISVDLSAAFDVVDHDLLIKRMQTLNLPTKIINLLNAWLKDRNMYVTVNDSSSIFVNIIAGTLQGSCLGPILFALFISPMFDLSDSITYADDNYTIETDKTLEITIGKVKMKAEILMQWLKDSGMQVNSKKTEFCIFHKLDMTPKTITLFSETITSKNEIKILGVTFDSKLNWSNHITKTILKCKKTLQAIRLISNYFTIDEKLNIVTSLLYSRLYYAAEVWLIPTLKSNLKQKLYNISKLSLKIVAEDHYNVFSGEELHFLFNRFTPNQMSNYVALLNLHRIINNRIPEEIWIELQFNVLPITRANKILIPPKNKLRVGVNSLLNRLSYASTLITNDDLNKEYQSFKVLAKKIVINT